MPGMTRQFLSVRNLLATTSGVAFLVLPLLALPAAGQEHDHPPGEHEGHSHAPPARQSAKPEAPIAQVLFQAERALERQELQLAESHYRGALLEGWLLMGSLEILDGNLEAAHDALYRTTQVAATGQRVVRTSYALIQLWTGEVEEAVATLGELAALRPADLQLRVHHVHALVLAGQEDAARAEIEALREKIPEFVARLEKALDDTADNPEARREAFLPRLNVGELTAMS
jgi:hypothetical protein